MTVAKRYEGIKGDECQCGRRMSIRHCVVCGSSRIYARQNRVHRFLDGSSQSVDVQFRCQSCGHLFIEEEREFCDAPPIGVKLAQQKVAALAEAKRSGEYLRPKDKKLAEAISELIIDPEQAPQVEQVLSENDLKKVWFSIRNAWMDLKFQNKGVSELSLMDFLSKHLVEAKIPQQYINQILQWQKDETERVKTESVSQSSTEA